MVQRYEQKRRLQWYKRGAAYDEGKYVIIDDEYVIQDSQLPHFILTNPYDGITANLVNRAIKILNG